MEYYWQLVTKDDTKYDIPPDAVETVKRRMDRHDPINLRTATVPYSEIKKFQITSKPYGQPLLEAAAQAFGEPVFFERDSGHGYTEKVMEARWVKKTVSRQEYTRHYSHLASYRRLEDNGTMVTVAFLQPVHEINLAIMEHCTQDDLTTLKQ